MLAKGLKDIPTSPIPASNRGLLTDFNSFARNMRFKCRFANSDCKTYPFHVKSSWQPPPQPSVANESYLERTKFEIATVVFFDTRDSLRARQRQKLKKRKYQKRVLEVEIGSFTSLVFGTNGVIGEECKRFMKHLFNFSGETGREGC